MAWQPDRPCAGGRGDARSRRRARPGCRSGPPRPGALRPSLWPPAPGCRSGLASLAAQAGQPPLPSRALPWRFARTGFQFCRPDVLAALAALAAATAATGGMPLPASGWAACPGLAARGAPGRLSCRDGPLRAGPRPEPAGAGAESARSWGREAASAAGRAGAASEAPERARVRWFPPVRARGGVLVRRPDMDDCSLHAARSAARGDSAAKLDRLATFAVALDRERPDPDQMLRQLRWRRRSSSAESRRCELVPSSTVSQAFRACGPRQ